MDTGGAARGNVGSPAYRGLMSAPAVLTGLRPEAAAGRRSYEVVLVVPRVDGGEPLVPCALPPQVLGVWSADRVTVSAVLSAARPSGAVAAVEALVPELARAAGAVVTVRPALPAAGML